MTKEQIAELQRLDADGHRAPWTWQGSHRVVAGTGTDVHSILSVGDGTFQDKALITVARNVLPLLLAEREALLEALKAAQWGGEAGHWEESGCPVCRSAERDGVGGHDAECLLASALAKAESE